MGILTRGFGENVASRQDDTSEHQSSLPRVAREKSRETIARERDEGSVGSIYTGKFSGLVTVAQRRRLDTSRKRFCPRRRQMRGVELRGRVHGARFVRRDAGKRN